jgi:hypothetical protein
MGPKGGRPTKPDTLAIEQRRARVAEAYLRGQYQHEIAQRENVDQATISRDLKALQARWKASGIRNLDAHKERELTRIAQLERTYWEAWERSLQERQTSHTRTVTTARGNFDESGQKTEKRDGDPRFLDGVRRCIEARCRLLDLFSGERRPGEVPAGTPPATSEAECDRRLFEVLAGLAEGEAERLPPPPAAGGQADGAPPSGTP